MRIIPSLACISALSLLAACGGQDGYYDNNGNYIAPPNATTDAQRVHSPSPGQSSGDYYRERHPHKRHGNGKPYNYERRGYYDDNGYYIDGNDELNVPEDMFPPRGMCRVWFTDRVPSRQPGIESCTNIRSRVPAGAYVIYGG